MPGCVNLRVLLTEIKRSILSMCAFVLSSPLPKGLVLAACSHSLQVCMRGREQVLTFTTLCSEKGKKLNCIWEDKICNHLYKLSFCIILGDFPYKLLCTQACINKDVWAVWASVLVLKSQFWQTPILVQGL